jgi:5-methylcytosine-specific restriction endonuclease McrA
MKPGSAGGPGAGKKTTPKQREETLQQNGGKCVVPGCNKPAEHTDHAIPRSRNGDTTDANRQGMCAHHNCQKGAKTSDEYEKWRKDRPNIK